MRHGGQVGVVGLVVFAAAFGCGSKGDDAAEGYVPGQPLAESEFPDAFAAVTCDNLERCCQMSRRDCSLAVSIYLALIIPDEDAPLEYDAQAASDCIAQSTDVDCAAAADNPACNEVYRGTIAPGEPCDADMFNPLYSVCTAPEGGTPKCDEREGHCYVELRGAEGDSCLESCQVVGYADYCTDGGEAGDTTSTICWHEDGVFCQEAQCVPLGAAGASCSDNLQCEDGLYCEAETCTEVLAMGAECGDSDDGACGDERYCEPRSLTCTARNADGEACSHDSECLSSACDRGSQTCLPPVTARSYCDSPAIRV